MSSLFVVAFFVVCCSVFFFTFDLLYFCEFLFQFFLMLLINFISVVVLLGFLLSHFLTSSAPPI